VRWTDFWIQLIYQGPLTGIIALLVYTRAIAMLGATRASAFTALLPLTAMLLAISCGWRMAQPAHRHRRVPGRLGRPAGDHFFAALGPLFGGGRGEGSWL
jgi:drug/metabolite transporter (DMT)-like permease